MINELFVIGLAAASALYLGWGFRHLPGEKWQILATLPIHADESGRWQGINFTWYGLLMANAVLVSVVMVFLLLGAIGVERLETAMLVVVMLGVCLPASKLVALIVEKKAAVASVAGASFVGVLLAPWTVLLANHALGVRFSAAIPLTATLAAMAITYAVGEGLGRLACISFGCCYGKSLDRSRPLVRRLFRDWHFVFRGETKKIAYASGMAGTKVIPVQALTALLYVGVALVGTWLYLRGDFAAALALAMGVTQLWRALSEMLRADYRGAGKVSAYQVFAVLSVVYVLGVMWLVPAAPAPAPALMSGLESLWHPGMVLFLLAVWAATFVYYGRSAVTGSRLELYVCHDKI